MREGRSQDALATSSSWTPSSILHEYQHGKSTTTAMGTENPKWAKLQEKCSTDACASGKTNVYEVKPGEEVRKHRDHVCIHPSVHIPDNALPQLKGKADAYDQLNMQQYSLTKEKMWAVDLLYKKEAFLVSKLNAYMQDKPFGPYDHVFEAVNQLVNWRKRSKVSKAQQLEDALHGFAVSVDSDLASLKQWPELMLMTRQCDAFSHPMQPKVLAQLRQALDQGNTSLAPVAGALRLLLNA